MRIILTRTNPRLALGLVCLAIFIGAIDLTVVTAVLPKMMVDLRVSIDSELNRAAWVISGYLLAYTVSMTFMGRLSDLLGRRSVYLICLAIFIVGSAIVAAASSLTILVSGRVVQALGAGAMVPVSMALVGDLFPVGRRAAALGLIGAVDTAGWMVGHLYGGVLMRAFDDWRLLFWVNVPLGLLALGLTWYAMRGTPVLRATGSFDWLGAALIAASITALNVGLAAGAELGATDFYGERTGPPPYGTPLVALSIALLAAFIWVERRATSPLLDLRLFARPGVAAACIINVLAGFALALALTNVPLFITTRLSLADPTNPAVLRQAAWEAGWMLSALTLTMAAAAVPGGRLTSRFGPGGPTLGGMLLATAGYLLLSRWGSDASYLVMGLELALAGLGLGLVISPVADTVIAAASEDERGSASALVIALRLIGMTLGVAVLTLYGVQRQDGLRQAGTTDPLASSEPTRFLMNVAAQVISETFLFGAVACALGVVAALWLGRRRAHS